MIVKDGRIERSELARLVLLYFEDMVKYVVDVERGVVAVGGEMHADAEQVLLEDGSRQADLWGANYYPGRGREGCIEYTSLINIRPAPGNRSMEIQDPAVRERVREHHLDSRRRRASRCRDAARLAHAGALGGLRPRPAAPDDRERDEPGVEALRSERRGRLANAYERILRLADLTVEVQASRSLRQRAAALA